MEGNIIEVIHRLTYEVNDTGLDKQISKLQKEADIIDDLKKKQENLRVAQSGAANQTEYDKLTASIANNQKAIDARTAALQKSFDANKKLQAALNEEIGIIGRLSDLLKRLKEEQKAATDEKSVKSLTQTIAQITNEIKRLKTASSDLEILPAEKFRRAAGYIEGLENRIKILRNTLKTVSESDAPRINQAIIQTQNELKRATSPAVAPEAEGGRSVLAQILGIGNNGTIGKQLLQGSLYAFGIGSGFGLVTRLTDAIIKFGGSLLDAKPDIEVFLEEIDKMNTALGETLDKVVKLQEAPNLFTGLTELDRLQLAVNNLKAIGVVNGEIYDSQKKIYDAEQNQRKGEIDQLYKEKDAYDALRKAAGVLQGFGSVRDQEDALNSITPDRRLQTQIRSQIKLTRDKDGKINLGANPTQVALENEARLEEEIKKKQAEQGDAEIKFNNDLQREIYEANRQMLIENRKAEEEYNVSRLKDYRETSDRIVEGINLQRNEALAEVNDEIELSRKKGILTAQIEQDYANKKADINRKYNLQVYEQLQEFIHKYTAIGDQIEKSVISAAPNTLSALLNPDEPSIEENIALSDARNKKLLADYSSFSEQLEARAIKDADTQKEINDELARQKELTIKQTNANLIKVYTDYYEQVEAMAFKNAQRLTTAQQVSHSQNRADIAYGVLTGRIGRRFGAYASDIQGLYSTNDQLRNGITATQTSLGAAVATSANVSNSPASTAADIANAKAEVNNLKKQLADLQTQLYGNEQAIKDRQHQFIKDQIADFTELADAGIQAYQQIAAAHQKYLDTEISIQTERVREAEVLAQRGNTAALQQQQDTLNAQNKQKETAAKREIEINEALTASRAILAVVNAAVDGDPYTTALRVAEAILAIGAGILSAEELSKNSAPAFAEGVVGFKGKGTATSDSNVVRISNGESVMTAAATEKYGPMLEKMNAGAYDEHLQYAHGGYYTPTKAEWGALHSEMKENTAAIRGINMHVNARVDRRGLAIYTQEAIRENARRWK